MSLLVVDDDPRLRELLRMALERAGFQVATASDGPSALREVARLPPDLVVLDIGLPEMDGFEVCRQIRTRSQVPILFLTARDDEIDRIVGLEMGADDYVTKPFSPREVVARIKAILKRRNGALAQAQVLSQGALVLDPQAKRCRFDGEELALTGMEFALLDAMLRAPSGFLTRAGLVTAVWGAQSPVSDRTLDSHLRNLRRKLADVGCTDAILSVHGQGMRLGTCEAQRA